MATQFQYKIIKVIFGTEGNPENYSRSEADGKERRYFSGETLEHVLNELGIDRWELVTTIDAIDNQKRAKGSFLCMNFIFKKSNEK